MRFCRLSSRSARSASASCTIAKPEKMAPATKYGGKIVVCQPGMTRRREVERDDGVHARAPAASRGRRGSGTRARSWCQWRCRAAPAERERCRRSICARRLLVARSRSVARSGTRPTYQNSSETVKYVETANTSQISGLRKFGHMLIWFGIGNSQYAHHGRPMWNSGKMPRAHDGEDRHRLGGAVDATCATSAGTGTGWREISVPAWPIPIQKTKFVMSHAQPTGLLLPHTPMPVADQVARASAPSMPSDDRRRCASAIHQLRAASCVSATRHDLSR